MRKTTAAVLLVFGLSACGGNGPDEIIVSTSRGTAVAYWCERHAKIRDELHTATYAVPDGATARIGQVVPRGWRRISSESHRTDADCG